MNDDFAVQDDAKFLSDARRAFTEKFSTVALANSVDGRTFTFQGPITLFLNPGDYVRITSHGGDVHIGQVLDSEIRQFDGPEVQIQDKANNPLEDVGYSVQGASFRMQMSSLRGSGILLKGGTSSDTSGFFEARIEAASEEDIRSIQSDWSKSRATLTVGDLQTSAAPIPAKINAGGFNRHTFMCGQSGSGKTYSLGVVLEQILLHTDLRVAIVDPNADYIYLNTPNSGRRAAEPGSDEARMVERYEARTADLKVFRPHVDDATNELPLRIRFSDLSQEDQATVMMLDPLLDRDEYDVFRRMAHRLSDRPYHVGDIRNAALEDLSSVARQVLLRVSNLGIGDWSVWADEGEQSLTDLLASDWRSVVLDVSRFERPIERSVMALAALRHFWNRRTERKPVLLVIDEAHNVCPKEPGDAIQAAATELMIAIAGEGRKYGIYLLLSTQRPDKIHPNVLSQCDNLMLMRMNSQADLAELQQVFSFVPPAILMESVAFRQGEALIAGTLVHSPMLTQMGRRITKEGGADVETTWTQPQGE